MVLLTTPFSARATRAAPVMSADKFDTSVSFAEPMATTYSLGSYDSLKFEPGTGAGAATDTPHGWGLFVGDGRLKHDLAYSDKWLQGEGGGKRGVAAGTGDTIGLALDLSACASHTPRCSLSRQRK